MSRRRDRPGSPFQKAAEPEGQLARHKLGEGGRAGGGAFGPRRPPVHGLERALFFVVSAHLTLLPWAFGTMHPPAQFCSFALAVVGFVLALVPRATEGERREARGERAEPENAETLKTETLKAEPNAGGTPALPGQSQISNLKSQIAAQPDLLRFPLFWLGLALLGLVLVQALNPAWAYHTEGKAWSMRAIPHTSWLPTGVDVPFSGEFRTAQGGPWRMLLIYGSAWLTVCAVWVGFTRRRTLQGLFVVIVANGAAISLFGLAQRMLGVRRVMGIGPPMNDAFFGPFLYKNHAGGYLLLTLAVAVALGAWYYVRGVRRLDKSSPAGLFAFIVTCIAVSIFLSYARGATLVTLGYLGLVVVGFIVFQWRLPAARSPIVTVALLLVFGGFLATGLTALNSGRAWDRLQRAFSGQELTVEWRKVANQASAEMLADHWVSGVGSGGFPFLYSKYAQKYPVIAEHMAWPDAHNDLLQIPIELGLEGVLIILASFASWGVLLARNRAWQNPLSVCLIVALLMFVPMSWGDFFFYSAPILITWCALWPATARWTILEEQRAG